MGIVLYLIMKILTSIPISLLYIIIYAITVKAETGVDSLAALRSQKVLDSLRIELRRIDRELESGTAKEKGVLRELDASERRLALLEGLVRDQKRQMRSVQDSIRSIETEIGPRETELVRLGTHIISLEDHQHQLSFILAKSMLAERRLSGLAVFDFLLGAESWQELLARRAAIKRLQRTVSLSMDDLTASVSTLRETEDAIFVSTQSLRERKLQLETSRKKSRELASDLENDIKNLENGKRELQSKLGRLRKDRKFLEQHRHDIAASQTQIEAMIEKVIRGEPIAGASILLLKGALPWPIIGRVVSKFGMMKNRELATVTENPGIDISAASDAPVTSIAEGVVSSVTWLRGFGNVCIAEHPGSFYTVYAKLGQVIVQPGDPLRNGTVIGYPGFDTVADEYRIHFELWSGKEKQNPLDWLRQR